MWAAIIAGAQAVIGGIGQANQNQAAEIESLARGKQQDINTLKNIRNRFRFIREANVKRAASVAEARAMGGGITAASSSAQGAQGSVQSQLFGTIDFLEQLRELNVQRNKYLDAAALKRSESPLGKIFDLHEDLDFTGSVEAANSKLGL